MAEFNFLLPPGAARPDGGGAYIAAMAASLREGGHGTWFGDGPASAIRVIDGMALPTLAPGQIAGAIGIVHHTGALAPAQTQTAVRTAERALLPLLHRVVATSEAMGQRLVAEFGVDPNRLTIIPPGVPDAPRSAGHMEGDCTVLAIGALVPRKGHAVLLRALARLFDLPWRLVIVGDTERDAVYAAALRQQIAEAGCGERVRLAGRLPAPALESLWRQADVFALATEWEGHSATVAEALRRGLPVAVTSGGSAAALVTPGVGVVCSPGDAEQLSKAIRRLIFDAGLRADMAEAAWQLGQTLPGWPAQAARFLEVAGCC